MTFRTQTLVCTTELQEFFGAYFLLGSKVASKGNILHVLVFKDKLCFNLNLQ